MVVGALQVIDGILLIAQAATAVSVAFSLAEFAWVPVSIWALISCAKAGLPRWAPVSYVAYSAISWLFGFVLTVTKAGPAATVVPGWYALIGALFGAWFIFASARLRRAAATAEASRPAP